MADSGRLDELNRKFDENPRRYFAPLANEYRKCGDLERAIELCRAYLPQQPGHMSGYIVYGQALFDAGRGSQAADIFQEALALDPENIIALRYLGDIARDADDREAALSWYRRVVEFDPKNEEVLLYISQLSSDSPTAQPQHSPLASPLQTVHPEPAQDADAVALGDLVHQPDSSQPVQAAPQDQVVDLPSIADFLVSAQSEESPPPVDMIDVSHPLEEESHQEVRIDTPFVTETMADLYQQQGFTVQALEIYRRLAQERDEPRLWDKAQQLEEAIEMERRSAERAAWPEESPPTPPVQEAQLVALVTIRDFFARIGKCRPSSSQLSPAAGRGLGELFNSSPLDASDINSAAALAGAYTSSH